MKELIFHDLVFIELILPKNGYFPWNIQLIVIADRECDLISMQNAGTGFVSNKQNRVDKT